jgi:two-component system, OmpR family, sensor histidine kinase KdpD
MTEEDRPDPEALLSALKSEESRKKRGKLKIFLGMSAGVGKTYAMLEAAQIQVQEGVDVLVGTVNTHGRQETAKLLEGLKILPEKWIHYKDTVFEELDIDEILRLKPQLVLVDELAHTNVPGSRHPKRWQDVMEILDAGIDVYTTLNVQHIESRKDVVENIAGILIRETVPDLIVETATYIELVDITPDELLKRLKEGKVYLGTQSEIAARNFFQEDRLTALREISLRLTAEKVDHDLHSMISTTEGTSKWKARERLMVAISNNPHSGYLIRTARRIAFTLDAPWIAVHVDDGSTLDEEDNATLARNLALARELGAEVITTSDPDIAQALLRIARQKNITQLIIGRSPRWVWKRLFKASLLERLTYEASDIDVHVIRLISPVVAKKRKIKTSDFLKNISPYLLIFIFSILIFLFNYLIAPIIGYKLVGFIFFLAILVFSLFFTKGPVLFAALLNGLIWEYFFLPPLQRFADTEDIALILLYFLTAVVTGILTTRARERQSMLLKREKSTETLYQIIREIASAPSSTQAITEVKERLEGILDGHCEILVKQYENGQLNEEGIDFLKDEKEKAVATWVFQNGKEAGLSTTTLPSVNYYYIPLKGYREIVGVLAYQPKTPRTLDTEEINFLYTVAQQLANYLERSLAEERKRKSEYLSQVEKIYQTVLKSISHEFQQPLKSIKRAIYDFKSDKGFFEQRVGVTLIRQMDSSTETLVRIVDNISAMAKLSEGLINIQKELHDVRQLINACYENVKKSLQHHYLKIIVPDDLPLVSFDFSLMELLLCNLLFNAIEYSPPQSTIEVEAKISNQILILSVADEGKGIPPDMIDLVFEKFYRLPGTHSAGVGLGLAIAKAIAQIHLGKLKVQNRERGGAIFSVLIPLE